MANQPLVSILMNCYNGEPFLKEAIDSVYSQTYKNWEIIFWDNASADKTSDIATSYDSRLNYYRSKKTTLLGEARVLASKKAKGKYLAFLDCDDLWVKDKLEKQIKIFADNDPGLGFVYGKVEAIGEDGSKLKHIGNIDADLEHGNIFNSLAKGNFVTFSSAIVDREKFISCGGFPSHFKNSTDYWVFLRMAQKFPVGVVQDICCKYRVHGNNLSSTQRVVGTKEAIEVVSSFVPDKSAIIGLKHQYVHLALMYMKEKKIMSALKVLINNGGCVLFYKYFVAKLLN